MNCVDVAVIGAGLAGVAAAGDLAAAGKSVLVIDKSRGIGGRMATRRHGGTRIDHGAQFFTARSERFSTFINSLVDVDIVQIWSHGFPVLLDGVVCARPDGYPRYACPAGMSELAKQLLPESVECVLGTQVTAVIRLADPVGEGMRYEVLAGESTVCLARDVVLNLPPVQLVAVAGEILTDVETERLLAVEMEPCWALGGCLAEDIPLTTVALECQHPVLGWISRNHTRRGNASEALSIMVHASGAWSAAHLENDPQDVRKAIESSMHDIGMPLVWDGEPFIHRWRYAKPVVGIGEDVFRLSSAPGVYGVGDWCIGGRVEGAVSSGWSAAAIIGSF
jgi:predicted NAD/FAD-dependent oxidoreductase